MDSWGGQLAAQEPTEHHDNSKHGAEVDEQDAEKPGELLPLGTAMEKQEEGLQDPDKGDQLGWDNFPPSKEGGGPITKS